MQFELTLPSKDGMVIDAAESIEALHLDRARDALGFEIWFLDAGRSKCIARVKAKTELDFNWAIAWVLYTLNNKISLDSPLVEFGEYADVA